MDQQEREKIIEKAGIEACDHISALEDMIDELHEFLNVIRIAHTKGFKLVHGQNKRQNTGFWNP